MNYNRLIQFGRYDLTTNRTFYRNMYLLACCLGLGLSMINFLFRWLIYSQEGTVVGSDGNPVVDYFAHYTQTPATTFMLTMLFTMLPLIFAGCTFHTLRKRQGRINELTLPAENIEKYCWHVGFSIIGGLLLGLCALLSADLINVMLHLIVFGAGDTFSLTARVFDVLTFGNNIHLPLEAIELFNKFLNSLTFMAICGTIFTLAFFVYGNTVKYRYNIILTYAFLQLFNVALFIVFIAIFANTHTNQDDNLVIFNDLCTYMIAFGILALVCAVFTLWRGYVRYTKAQICDRWNKLS